MIVKRMAGNTTSLGMTIPARVVDKLEIEEQDDLDFNYDKKTGRWYLIVLMRKAEREEQLRKLEAKMAKI